MSKLKTTMAYPTTCDDQQCTDFVTQLENATFYVQTILSITGILGNALVCVTIAKAKFMHNFTNFLIGHLAVADFLVCLALAIFQERFMGNIAEGDNVKHEIFCKFFHGQRIVWLLCDVSIFSMVFVTVERYLGIVHPLKYPRLVTKTRVGIGIVVIWSITIAVKIPYLAAKSFNDQTGECFKFGIAEESAMQVIVFSELETWLPPAILFGCYGKILISLRKSAENQQRHNNHAPANELLTARRRVVKVLMIVSSLYLIIWVSIHTFFLNMLYNRNLSPEAYNILIALQRIFATVNSVVNPFVYAFKYKEFQRGMRCHVFRCCQRTGRVAGVATIE